MSINQIQKPSMEYILQSKIDNKIFKVDQKIIDSSSLLKNICDLTQITNPIPVNCKSQSLNIFFQLINHYEIIDMDYHDHEFEGLLYRKNFSTDQKLIEFIQDLCILDSDFFFDSISDFILEKMKEMSWKEIQKYLGLEDDYTKEERNEIDANLMKYFLSIDFGILKFPFKNKSLYSLKTTFSTPMNVLIARIIQRSNEDIASSLSLINKTMKNESDRNPFKLVHFSSGSNGWLLKATFGRVRVERLLDIEKSDNYDFIKNRKIISKEFSMFCDSAIPSSCENGIHCSSFNFAIPYKSSKLYVKLQRNSNLMYNFDVKECPFLFIRFTFCNLKDGKKDFEEIYNHLIAKDLSKEIELQTSDIFNFVHGYAHFNFSKKAFASKFYKLYIFGIESKKVKFLQNFKNFILNYMEHDGVIICSTLIEGCPKKPASGNHYPISFIKEHLESICFLQ